MKARLAFEFGDTNSFKKLKLKACHRILMWNPDDYAYQKRQGSCVSVVFDKRPELTRDEYEELFTEGDT